MVTYITSLARSMAIGVFVGSLFVSTAHAQTGLVTVFEQPGQIQWQIDATTFQLGESRLTVIGPEQDGAIPAFCEENPFVCNLESTSGVLELNITGFAAGNYNWQVELVPDTSDVSACDSPSSIREQQGGQQGLDETIAQSYIDCLRANGILPPEDQPLKEFGSFLITENNELVVPDDSGGTDGGDNQPPVAQCKDVTIILGENSCSVEASVDDGSFDPDGTLASLEQDPAGPFGPGDHNVTLTATDDGGLTASCSAVVTVIDETQPVISCNAPGTITPPDAPVSFTATAADACGATDVSIASYDCYKFTKKGKRVDKTDSCVVSASGATATILDSGGVGTTIEWSVAAADGSGNTAEATCSVQIANPGQGNGQN